VSTSTPTLITLRVVGAVVATVAVLSVAWSLATGAARARSSESFDVASISAVHVEASAGEVTFERATGDRVEVEMRSESTWRRPELTRQVDGDTLRLRADCPSWARHGWGPPWWGRWGGCKVHLHIAVPDGVAVDVRNNAGRVRVDGIDGDVSAHLEAGEIVLSDVRSQVVDLSTDAGRVSADFADAPQQVTATTSTGAIEIRVPDDGTAYAVDASSEVGPERVQVPEDSASSHRVSARTQVGAVIVATR
jgi:hypothetical protein